MRHMKYVWVMVIGLGLSTGCTVLDGWVSNPYEKNYFPLITSSDSPVLVGEPEIQQTLMRRHAERVALHTGGGWRILGESEFNTAHSPSNRQLKNQARSVGAELVVHSREFTRREQEWVQRREYEPGEHFTVNGTTIVRPGKWVERHEPVTRQYHNYRATFLRRCGE